MVKAQEWLDREYPKEGWKEKWTDYSQGFGQNKKKEWRKRSEVWEVYLDKPDLEGELDLGDFTYRYDYSDGEVGGVKILISLQVDETKLAWKNLPKNARIVKCVEVQKWLDQNYPPKGICMRENEKKNWKKEIKINNFGKTRSEITELDISWQNLEGHLNLNDFSNLKELDCSNNKLTDLDCSNCEQLEEINCFSNSLTFITLPTNLTNLRSLGLGNNNFPNQDLINKFGSCLKCCQSNTSEKWCQSCAEKEWVGLAGQELVEKFIHQQPGYGAEWIPYEQFTNIEQIGEGGFSKIYKAKWEECKDYQNKEKMVALKSLTNSQNITLEFLTEITNTKLVDSDWDGRIIVKCHGISQDPVTKNYVIVMNYMKDGNLRKFLQNKNSELSLENKLDRLKSIANGLSKIHSRNLVHRDFHSGNILNEENEKNNLLGSYISDLGLSCPANHQKRDGKIFGVLPYVAPEVLQGQPYTKASDVYSWGIVAYELLANRYPYPETDNLALQVCLGLRPELDKIPLPQEVKDLIKKCWDADSAERPSIEELSEIIISDWYGKEIMNGFSYLKNNIPFYQQYQTIEQEYNTFSQNTPYQIHSNAITTSKMIDTKQITKLLQHGSKDLKLDINDFDLGKPNLQEENQLQAQIEQPPK